MIGVGYNFVPPMSIIPNPYRSFFGIYLNTNMKGLLVFHQKKKGLLALRFLYHIHHAWYHCAMVSVPVLVQFISLLALVFIIQPLGFQFWNIWNYNRTIEFEHKKEIPSRKRST
jgi:hypothetical protein